VQLSAGHRLRDERVHTRLGYWAVASTDLIDLDGVNVHSPDVMVVDGEAGQPG
jgi:hypothetical protein